MSIKQLVKISIDILMTFLFMLLMAYHVTENRQHEWLGVTLFVLFIIHHILNRKWYAGLFKGRYSAVRLLTTTINFLLLAAMLGMMLSGFMISRDVFSFVSLGSGMFGHRLHLISTSWGYLLMSAHIGLHWGMVLGFMKKHGRPNSKLPVYIGRALVLAISLYGIYAFITRQLWERMFLLMDFALFDYQEPAIYFFADYLSILILFAALAFYLAKSLRKI